MDQAEQQGRYWPGTHTEEERNAPHVYVVNTIQDNEFVYVGTVTITMGEVWDAMDEAKDIKGNMPSKFARKHAAEKYPGTNPILVMEIEDWEEKYDSATNYKQGDVVK